MKTTYVLLSSRIRVCDAIHNFTSAVHRITRTVTVETCNGRSRGILLNVISIHVMI